MHRRGASTMGSLGSFSERLAGGGGSGKGEWGKGTGGDGDWLRLLGVRSGGAGHFYTCMAMISNVLDAGWSPSLRGDRQYTLSHQNGRSTSHPVLLLEIAATLMQC